MKFKVAKITNKLIEVETALRSGQEETLTPTQYSCIYAKNEKGETFQEVQKRFNSDTIKILVNPYGVIEQFGKDISAITPIKPNYQVAEIPLDSDVEFGMYFLDDVLSVKPDQFHTWDSNEKKWVITDQMAEEKKKIELAKRKTAIKKEISTLSEEIAILSDRIELEEGDMEEEKRKLKSLKIRRIELNKELNG